MCKTTSRWWLGLGGSEVEVCGAWETVRCMAFHIVTVALFILAYIRDMSVACSVQVWYVYHETLRRYRVADCGTVLSRLLYLGRGLSSIYH